MEKKTKKAAPKLGARKKSSSGTISPARKKKAAARKKPSSGRKLKLDMNKESSPLMKFNAFIAVLIFLVGAYLAYKGQLGEVLAPILP